MPTKAPVNGVANNTLSIKLSLSLLNLALLKGRSEGSHINVCSSLIIGCSGDLTLNKLIAAIIEFILIIRI